MAQIKVSEILTDLTNGLTRADIKEKYNLSSAQMKMLFQHSQLKGRKTKKVEEPIEIVDDVTRTDNQTTMEFAEEVSVRPATLEETADSDDDFM